MTTGESVTVVAPPLDPIPEDPVLVAMGPRVPPPPGTQWVPVPGTPSRPIKFKVSPPANVPGGKGGQPGASQDNNHWDVDGGNKVRDRFDNDGNRVNHDGEPIEGPSPLWWLPNFEFVMPLVNPCLLIPGCASNLVLGKLCTSSASAA